MASVFIVRMNTSSAANNQGNTYTLGTLPEPPRCSHADKGHVLDTTR